MSLPNLVFHSLREKVEDYSLGFKQKTLLIVVVDKVLIVSNNLPNFP